MNAAPVPFVIAMMLGTIKKPKLTNITTGKFVGKSLVFHTQEATEYVESNGKMVPFGKYYEYSRKTVNKTTVSCVCTFRNAPRNCKATLTLEPTDLHVIETEKIDGGRDKHKLKTGEKWEEFMRKPDFWKVRERKGKIIGHTCTDINSKLLLL